MATFLGRATWTDPDRLRSINLAVYTRMRRGWFRGRRTVWAVNPPALQPLLDASKAIADLIEQQQEDFWNGETTQPSWALDETMHGKSTSDAQPTIICSSPSNRCQRNAKVIIERERIPVDDRGISLEFYPDRVVFYAGSVSENTRKSYDTYDKDHQFPSQGVATFSNGVPLHVGPWTCTGGGVVLVGGRPYILTVAHAFESSGRTILQVLLRRR
jgi:hypothetical protein